MRWEYRELATADLSTGFDIPTFNSLGDEGWELVAIYERPARFMEPYGSTSLRALVAVFKRQIAEVGW